MSYLLDFPTGLLPHDVRSPPYVIFAIQGQHIIAKLPPRIPLKLVLHFAPKLKQWVLPPPSTTHLQWSDACLALRTPYVGLNIPLDDIDATGLEWIITRMLLASGLATPKDLFLIDPSILASISIHRTWVALNLPIAGIQNLHKYIHTNLMLGSAVTLPEISAIWEVFPRSSPIVSEMGLNFIRSHINLEYTYRDFSSIRDWYLRTIERRRFFKSLEDRFPKFGAIQDMVLKAAAEKGAMSTKIQETANKGKEKAAIRVKKVLEKTGTKQVSSAERAERHKKDSDAMRKRVRRTKSDESIRSVETVIWDPPSDSKGDEGTADLEVRDSDAPVVRNISSKVSEAGQTVISGRTPAKIMSRLPQFPITGQFSNDLIKENLSYDADEQAAQSDEDMRIMSRAVLIGKRFATLRRKSGEEELKAEKRLRKFRRRE